VKGENDSTDVVLKFQEYMEYDDLRYFTMISMLEFLKSHSDVSNVALDRQPYLSIEWIIISIHISFLLFINIFSKFHKNAQNLA